MAGTRTITDYETLDEAYEARTLAFWGNEFDVDPTWGLEKAVNLSEFMDFTPFRAAANALTYRCCGTHEELVSINGEIWILIFSYGH